jgi:hypothetical protein
MWISLSVLVLGALFLGCATTPPTPSEQNFQDPVVTLNSVEVAHYWGWWYFSKKIEPTKGVAGDYGAPLDVAFIFDINNPNPYPVMMEYLKFTVAFEEFDLNTVFSTEPQWIPAGKTNQLRVHAMFDGRQSLLSLLVTGGFKLQEKGMGAGAGAALKQLGIWWEGIPEFSFPIHVKEGSAVFNADELMTVTTFSGTFPLE